MKRLTLCIAFLLMVFCNVLHAQNKSAKKDSAAKTNTSSSSKTNTSMAAMPDSAAMMKAWTDYMTPGKYHEMFAKDDGTWNEEITMWMDPSAPPTKNTATAENTMILGGRYQQSKHTGSFNGMPFEGISILGYDNAKKVFVSSWIDNMGTGIMNMEGTWDDTTKSVNFKGKAVDPMTGKEVMVRQVFKPIDDNNQLMTMYDTKNGQEVKTMEIKLTRKK